MPLMERLDEELKAAMRAGDVVRRDTIRLLRSSLKNAEIDNRGAITEEDEARVVAKEVKQRRDSIEEYRKANRADLADREQAELNILQAYQPEQLSADQIRDLVMISIGRTGAKGPGDIGKVMKDVMPDIRGRADGSAINAAARDILMSASG